MTDPNQRPDENYDRAQVSAYWKRVHNLAAEGFSDRGDELLPVVADPGAPDWEKRYVAKFQRKAFERTLRRFPNVSGLRGLEFGCGTGRWVKTLTDQGASMVGIDISEDVIARNRVVIPGAEFRCVDITEEPPEPESFDLVLSITVLQHLPYGVQEKAISALSSALKPHGSFLMLENIHDKARTVFPRPIDGWKRLAKDSGLKCTHARGYGFDVLPRLGRRVLSFSGFRSRAKQGLSRMTPEELADATYERYANSRRHRRYNYVFRPLVAASYLAEPVSQLILPSGWATHCAFVFKKEA